MTPFHALLGFDVTFSECGKYYDYEYLLLLLTESVSITCEVLHSSGLVSLQVVSQRSFLMAAKQLPARYLHSITVMSCANKKLPYIE